MLAYHAEPETKAHVQQSFALYPQNLIKQIYYINKSFGVLYLKRITEIVSGYPYHQTVMGGAEANFKMCILQKTEMSTANSLIKNGQK